MLKNERIDDVARIHLTSENKFRHDIHLIAKDIYRPSEAMVAARTRPMLR
ncbi:MAG TPA: hypothetical protein PLD88_05970 [Candidatus Berkiella sp.]|nr:hypothetical protein [Candidatus Berkiella sp.]